MPRCGGESGEFPRSLSSHLVALTEENWQRRGERKGTAAFSLQVCSDGGTLSAGAGDAGGTLGFAVISREGFSNQSLRSCQGGPRTLCCSAVGPRRRLSPAIGREPRFAGGDPCHLVLQRRLGIPPPVGYQISLYKERRRSSDDALLVRAWLTPFS